MNNSPITFVLPGDFRSGGVRVTVLMANLLLGRGYEVRIVLPKKRQLKERLKERYFRLRNRLKGEQNGWLHEFEGRVEVFDDIDSLCFSTDEIVIAVGSLTVHLVKGMQSPVRKVRFNHGFPAKPTAQQDEAWRGKMTTITVSRRLVPQLEELSGGDVWGVVPNGIDFSDYHVDDEFVRDGIGAVYNPHSNKAPEDLVAVLGELSHTVSAVPQRVFSTEATPEGLQHVEYFRYPSVAGACEIYNRSKVWLLTSYTEGLPGVVLEAMACGCVIVTSDNDGSLEIIRDGESGVVVPRGERDQFVAAVRRVLEDDAWRESLVAGSLATVAEFSWERAADRMELFIEELENGSVK